MSNAQSAQKVGYGLEDRTSIPSKAGNFFSTMFLILTELLSKGYQDYLSGLEADHSLVEKSRMYGGTLLLSHLID
jgi:hypothetical protein